MSTDYEYFMNMELNELAKEASGLKSLSTGSRAEFAKLVYNHRLINIQHDHAKEQIKIQHDFNETLFKQQKKLTIVTTILNCIVILITTLLTIYLGYILNQNTQLKKSEQTTQQIIQHSNESMTSDTHDVSKP